MKPASKAALLLLLPLLSQSKIANASATADPLCVDTMVQSLTNCATTATEALTSCYSSGNTNCSTDNSAISQALDSLQANVFSACASQTDMFGSSSNSQLSRSKAVSQLQSQCRTTAQTLAARTLGGPQAKALNNVTSDNESDCLQSANLLAQDYVNAVSAAHHQCLSNSDCSSIDFDINNLTANVNNQLSTACPSSMLEDIIGLPNQVFLQRTAKSADCHTAQAYPNQNQLTLACGPRDSVSATQVFQVNGDSTTQVFNVETQNGNPSNTREHIPQRGEFVEIELDASEFGARCGDGSNYRFWLQLAPAGEPLNRVYLYTQGGGGCVTNDECNSLLASDSPKLKNNRLDALGSNPDSVAFHTPKQSNPFRTGSKISLPYCTQDGHLGNGAEQVFSEGSVFRSGARNVRVALDYARDVIWSAMNAEGKAYLPNDFLVLFHGTSAGGVGASNHYHYVLDELNWSKTSVAKNTGLTLDNPLTDISTKLSLMESWQVKQTWPSYCQADNCTLGEVMDTAHAERLGSDPRQTFMWISDQWDGVQSRGFANQAAWTNILRETYCRMKDIPHLAFFLRVSEGHVVQPSATSKGVSLSDWLENYLYTGVANDLVEDQTPAIPGLYNFPCTVN
ncbi:hypothetical protein R50073_19590 [Maricurvus nonylphenolicus]|uniref:hypothetical protein n=1 Tax=Maricurvus nonylphenolicus TaxID=1008307 RepID=UPI0036F1D144